MSMADLALHFPTPKTTYGIRVLIWTSVRFYHRVKSSNVDLMERFLNFLPCLSVLRKEVVNFSPGMNRFLTD